MKSKEEKRARRLGRYWSVILCCTLFRGPSLFLFFSWGFCRACPCSRPFPFPPEHTHTITPADTQKMGTFHETFPQPVFALCPAFPSPAGVLGGGGGTLPCVGSGEEGRREEGWCRHERAGRVKIYQEKGRWMGGKGRENGVELCVQGGLFYHL